MDIDADVTYELERRLVELQPWMHAYRSGPETIVGTFKFHDVDRTACVRGDDPRLLAAMQVAYADHLGGAPGWEARLLVDRLDGEAAGMCAIDIASATGRHSFELARAGIGSIRGVEIRREQVEQATLVRDVDRSGQLATVEFEHDPVSADDPGFRAGERYDVVLSMGLLYHLSDPVQHVRNLRRLTGRALMLQTFTHARDRGFWQHVREDPGGITKAMSGTSWIPHFDDVPVLLREAGFDRVEGFSPATSSPGCRPGIVAICAGSGCCSRARSSPCSSASAAAATSAATGRRSGAGSAPAITHTSPPRVANGRLAQRSGAGVEPTQRRVTPPHRF